MVLHLNPALQANPPAGVPFIDGHGLGSAGPPPVPAPESRALMVSGKGFCLPMEMLGWLGDVDPFPILSGEPLFQRRESEGSHLDF